ncbi:hypothetical protein PR202_ga02476 [Eleusine coracana subsp. coracana]|uniref:Uncharacterized protein n=1 Tax=Eleusine coracana subsp. coracana TaxID=191504 RepID=A0AAV5BK74_ELECO|nr:hypothetical protein PR202_ga02476 [Eleusine coracana subsp. coracana]
MTIPNWDKISPSPLHQRKEDWKGELSSHLPSKLEKEGGQPKAAGSCPFWPPCTSLTRPQAAASWYARVARAAVLDVSLRCYFHGERDFRLLCFFTLRGAGC